MLRRSISQGLLLFPFPISESDLTASAAWYVKAREAFILDPVQTVVGELASGAASEGLHIEPAQQEEWQSSVGVLQRELRHRTDEIALLKSTLAAADLVAFRHVLLEFDFRRRGLRMDCVLLGDGVIAVIEFKRSKFGAADREQVINYAVNLVEFHEETRRIASEESGIVAPVLTLTTGTKGGKSQFKSEFLRAPWSSVIARPLECDGSSLHAALRFVLDQRRGRLP